MTKDVQIETKQLLVPPLSILPNPKKKQATNKEKSNNHSRHKEIHIRFSFNNNQKQIIGKAKTKTKIQLKQHQQNTKNQEIFTEAKNTNTFTPLSIQTNLKTPHQHR